MSEGSDIEKKYWFTNKQVIGLVAFAIIVTFSATKIIDRFEYVETEFELHQLLQEKKDNIQDERAEYINKRIDRKFDNLKEELKKEQ